MTTRLLLTLGKIQLVLASLLWSVSPSSARGENLLSLLAVQAEAVVPAQTAAQPAPAPVVSDLLERSTQLAIRRRAHRATTRWESPGAREAWTRAGAELERQIDELGNQNWQAMREGRFTDGDVNTLAWLNMVRDRETGIEAALAAEILAGEPNPAIVRYVILRDLASSGYQIGQDFLRITNIGSRERQTQMDVPFYTNFPDEPWPVETLVCRGIVTPRSMSRIGRQESWRVALAATLRWERPYLYVRRYTL